MNYIKFFFSLSAAVTALSMSSLYAAAESRSYTSKAYLKSDVNCDSNVDAVDASLVMKEYANVSTGRNSIFSETMKYVSDYDNSGKIDAVDASGILSLYVHNSISGNERNYSMVTFEVEYYFDRTESETFYANSYEECLEFIANDKKSRSIQNPAYYKVYYNEFIFGEVYDWIIKVVHTE